MATEIKTWEIVDGQLVNVKTSLPEEGRREKDHMEEWITTNTEILGSDVIIIGRQVQTKSGYLYFLGIDSDGNTVIVELKRDKLPREVVAQAIDYASDVSGWTVEKLSEISRSYLDQNLEDVISENFDEVNIEEITINSSQKLLLVGYGIDEPLSRMIEWLSTNFNMGVNAILLSYSKTSSGNEILSRTVIIPEEVVKQKSNKGKFKIPMSDDPGTYEYEDLKKKLKQYLNGNLQSARRMKDVMIPLLLKKNVVSREEIKKGFVESGEVDEKKSWTYMSLISQQLGHEWKDYLRQVIRYEYPNYHWEKDNFSIVTEYKDLVKEVLKEINSRNNAPPSTG